MRHEHARALSAALGTTYLRLADALLRALCLSRNGKDAAG
jgi:hypothetical protein